MTRTADEMLTDRARVDQALKDAKATLTTVHKSVLADDGEDWVSYQYVALLCRGNGGRGLAVGPKAERVYRVLAQVTGRSIAYLLQGATE